MAKHAGGGSNKGKNASGAWARLVGQTTRHTIPLGKGDGGIAVTVRHPSFGEAQDLIARSEREQTPVAHLLIAELVDDEQGEPLVPGRDPTLVNDLPSKTMVALSRAVLDAAGIELRPAKGVGGAGGAVGGAEGKPEAPAAAQP